MDYLKIKAGEGIEKEQLSKELGSPLSLSSRNSSLMSNDSERRYSTNPHILSTDCRPIERKKTFQRYNGKSVDSALKLVQKFRKDQKIKKHKSLVLKEKREKEAKLATV